MDRNRDVAAGLRRAISGDAAGQADAGGFQWRARLFEEGVRPGLSRRLRGRQRERGVPQSMPDVHAWPVHLDGDGAERAIPFAMRRVIAQHIRQPAIVERSADRAGNVVGIEERTAAGVRRQHLGRVERHRPRRRARRQIPGVAERRARRHDRRHLVHDQPARIDGVDRDVGVVGGAGRAIDRLVHLFDAEVSAHHQRKAGRDPDQVLPSLDPREAMGDRLERCGAHLDPGFRDQVGHILRGSQQETAQAAGLVAHGAVERTVAGVGRVDPGRLPRRLFREHADQRRRIVGEVVEHPHRRRVEHVERDAILAADLSQDLDDLVTRLALVGQRRVDAIEEHDCHRAAGAPLGAVAVLAGRERGRASDDLVGVHGEKLDPLLLAFVVQREVVAGQAADRLAVLVVHDDADLDEPRVGAEGRRLGRSGGRLGERGGRRYGARHSDDRKCASHPV